MNQSKPLQVVVRAVLVTAVFYAVFAWLLSLHPTWLSSKVPDGAVQSKLWLAVERAIRNGFIVVLTAAGIYCLYRLLGLTAAFKRRRISSDPVSLSQLARELFLTGNLLLAGGIQGMVYTVLTELGYSRIYAQIEERGWLYAVFSIIAYAVASDAWFYFAHRWFHKSDFLYHKVHHTHHMSVVTTPLSTNQVSPLELLSSGLMGALFVVLVPVATSTIFAMVVFFTIYQMLCHSGYELFPAGTPRHAVGKWLVTPTYHQMHHELYDKHMGLYFTWWDRWFGTYSDQYERRFAAVTGAACREPAGALPDPRRTA